MEEQNKETEVLFNVFPIIQEKFGGTMTDFRFACLLPNCSIDVRRCLLNPDFNEAFLLYAPEPQEIIGKQFKNGDTMPFYPDIAINDHHVLHFGMHMAREEGHLITRVFDYVQVNDLLDDYFELVAIIAKGAVKLGYKKVKRDMFSETEIVLPDSGLKFRLNPGTYEFDEHEFLIKKINKDLDEHPRAKEMFITIRTLFFLAEGDDTRFVVEHLSIGELLAEQIYLPINYVEN